MPLDSNPFTALTFIAAPAILTNAASVLALSTSNRFARAVDRARELAHLLAQGKGTDDPFNAIRHEMLTLAERRAVLLIKALRAAYVSLGSFAAGSITSLVGAGLHSADFPEAARAVIFIALAAGFVGVGGLMTGCLLLVWEVQLALENLQQEGAFIRDHVPAGDAR